MISITVTIMFFGRHLIFCGILMFFVVDRQSLRAKGLYITLASLNNMRKNVLSHMSSAVRNTMQVSVTVMRIEVCLSYSLCEHCVQGLFGLEIILTDCD